MLKRLCVVVLSGALLAVPAVVQAAPAADRDHAVTTHLADLWNGLLGLVGIFAAGEGDGGGGMDPNGKRAKYEGGDRDAGRDRAIERSTARGSRDPSR